MHVSCRRNTICVKKKNEKKKDLGFKFLCQYFFFNPIISLFILNYCILYVIFKDILVYTDTDYAYSN